jgi:hypothetical protein
MVAGCDLADGEGDAMKPVEHLQALKQKLLHDIELPPVWNYFMDHFGDHQEFMDLSETCQHEALQEMVTAVAGKLFPGPGQVMTLRLLRVPSQQFIHGPVSIGGRMGLVFYFEDADVGLLAISEQPGSAEAKYVRFSGEPIKRSGDPDMN